MKKLKYLLGFLIVGIGLLFNQSFGRTLYVDTSAYGGVYSDRNSLTSSMYKRTFKNTIHLDTEYSTTTYVGRLGYSLYYNGTTGIDIMNQLSQDRSCPTTYSGIQFNSSIYSYTPYNWSCYADWQNVAHYDLYYTYNYKPSSSVPIQILLGRGNEFGKVFIGVQNATAEMPIYGFGNGFANSNSFISVLDTDTSYLRLFGDIKVSQNIFSFDNYDPITMSGPYSTGLDGREYFYPRGTRTNYGYIIDDGNNNWKFKHFGLYDMGYSYVYGQGLSESASSISRNRLKFVTVEDNIETELKNIGDIPYSVFQEYSYPGLLLLKGTSYSSMGNDKGAYILSKDPSDPTRILYEHWSCNFSSIRTIFSGGNDLQSCLKLDAGYLTINGYTNVLPFTDFNTLVSFTGVSSVLLYDLLVGSDGTGYTHGETEIRNNKIYFNGRPTGYGFTSNDSVNIQELYLNGGTNTSSSTQLNNIFLSKCASDSNFYQNNYFICSAFLQSIGNPTQIPGTNDQYLSYGYDSSGNLTIWITSQNDLVEQMSGYERVQNEDGSWSTVCTSESCNHNYNSGYINSGDLGVGYFENFFDGNFFFSCPYSYSGLKFTVGSWLYDKLGTDILFPINCMIAGYTHGKNFHILNNSGLIFESRLLVNEDYRALYNFFDIVISLGIIFLMFRIYRLIK